MGIITGYISTVLLVLFLVKFLARKFRWNKVDQVIMKSCENALRPS